MPIVHGILTNCSAFWTGEIRLITPTDPEGKEGADESTVQAQPGQKYYQLTHDYLVHSLRDWLTRKQKETRRGAGGIAVGGSCRGVERSTGKTGNCRRCCSGSRSSG